MLTANKIHEFQEAVADAHAFADRRTSQRVKHQCHAEASLWDNGRAGDSFSVVLSDFATTGVGIRHTERFHVGSRYLLQIARPNGKPLASILTVVRCDETIGGWFDVALSPDEILEVALPARSSKPRPRSRVKIGLLAFAFAISAAGVFVLMH